MATTYPIEAKPRFQLSSGLVGVRWEVLIWGVLGFIILVSRLYLILIRPVMFFDESLYLTQTHAVWERGVMVPWAWNPGVAYLNVIWYSLFIKVPLALDYASRLATFLCSVSTIGLMILIVRNLAPLKSYWAMSVVVLALAIMPFWSVILNSSDNYYIVFVLLFFLNVTYALRHPPTHWTWIIAASLAAFSSSLRNDGTVVYAVSTLFYIWILWHSKLSLNARILTLVRNWLLPIVILMGLHWGIALARGGYYDAFYDTMRPEGTSVSERTYIAFEQGEGRIKRFEIEAQGLVWWSDGRIMAREVYGTPEKNNHDVLRAIRNNPTAWLERMLLNVRDFFLTWQESFGLQGAALFIAAAWGLGLLGRNQPRVAFLFLILLAPTSVFFLVTYWQPRYVITLAPIIVILAIYGLSVFQQTPVSSERKWGIGLAIITGIAFFAFYYFGETYEGKIRPHTFLFTAAFYGLFIWRFVIQRGFSIRLSSFFTVVSFLLLTAGSMRIPPLASNVLRDYSFESRDYIVYAQSLYPNAKVCYAFKDLDALSLIWYARQEPMPVSIDVRTDLYNGVLKFKMRDHNCSLALIASTGWDDRSLINSPDVIANTPTRIQFRSDRGTILLFDFYPEAE